MERDILTRVFDAIVKARVQRGLALLKEKYGDNWVDKIDPKQLDLADSAVCVVGQLYNQRFDDGSLDVADDSAYVRGLDDLNLESSCETEAPTVLSEADFYFGFNVHDVTEEELTDLGFSEEEQDEFHDAYDANGERLANLSMSAPTEYEALQKAWTIALGYEHV